MHKERIASVQLRHDMIQANKRQNYINEYDRINGMLTHNITHWHISYDHLTKRREKLKDLFEQSFKDQMHEYTINKIYYKLYSKWKTNLD